MSGEKRRDRLLQYLEEHDKPVSGTELAKEFGVSRQVIVQDIALFANRSCKKLLQPTADIWFHRLNQAGFGVFSNAVIRMNRQRTN